jgi:hypothetical protein
MAYLAPQGLKLIWEDKVLLIMDARVSYPVATWQDWSHVRLDVSPRPPTENERPRGMDFDDDYKFVPVRRTLTTVELEAAGKWILQNIPMPPISLPAYCPDCGDPLHTAVINLQIVLEGVKLSRDDPERIIGRISGNETSRILVGRLVKGQFSLEWISPLLEPGGQVLIFRDVDADGVGEIWSLSSYRGVGDKVWELSIFSLQGRELTRDAGECDWAVTSSLPTSPLAAACPIVGLPAIDHFVGKDGKVKIEAARDFTNNPQPGRLYEFVGGKYVRVKP